MAPKKKPSDFRYSTGDTKVPWHAVGEPYRVGDVLDVVRFLLPAKEGAKNYKARIAGVRTALQKLTPEAGVATKLTLGGQVARAEELARKFLKVKHACFLTNWTAGMEISFKLAGLRAGDEVIVPSITFIATMAKKTSSGTPSWPSPRGFSKPKRR
jgi:perosamine synthetase